MKRTYTYVYKVYTDNLCYGRMLIGEAKSKAEAEAIGWKARKGCYVVERTRVYND